MTLATVRNLDCELQNAQPVSYLMCPIVWAGEAQPMAGLPVAALGNGLCLAVLVYCTAGISGGHLNPAVSAGFLATGRLQLLIRDKTKYCDQ